MNVPKINSNIRHIKWCQNFMKEQEKSAQLVRKFLKKSRIVNPFNADKNIDNILKRYEKSFW